MTQAVRGAQFIRVGSWLFLLGLLMSFGMVLHYVVGAQYSTGEQFLRNVTLWFACPWTLSTAVVLGGSLSMIAIGTILALLSEIVPSDSRGGWEGGALAICTVALIAMFVCGYVGYFVVDAIWPSFYYSPITMGKNAWLLLQLACMVVYAVGVFIAFSDIRRATRALA